jgi:hypothetical protein
MNKINLKIILAITILLYSAKSFSQTTTTISYDATSNLSTTKCNVFDPPVNVGGKLHTGIIGGATFSTANGLTLPTSYTFSSMQTKRTDYRISYPFKSGYTYRIEFTAFGDVSNSTAYPSLGAALFTVAGLTLTSTSCGAVYNKDLLQLGSVLNTQLNGTSTTYSPSSANFTSPNNFDYLVLEATCQAAQNITANVYIQKIKIIETPPASFSITQSVSSISCGTTTPVTFTVNNGGGTTGITGYTWNLGATPNGWLLPNGTAAPATYSTGTTNTLTLTPVCGKALTNISATVTANGTNYNTSNSSAVSISQPSLSISGNSSLCSGSSPYTINGLICNSLIAWTAPPAGMGSLSSLTSSPTTLTYGGTSGNFTLTANVTSCGVAQVVTMPVHIGAYSSSDYTLSGNNGSMYWCPNQNITFTVSGTGSSNYNWTLPTGWTMNYNGGSYVAIKAPSSPNPPTGTLSVSFTEPCGTILTLNKYLAYSSSACTSSSPYSISPNPASSTITISCISLQTYCNIAAVQITDLYGNTKISQSWPYTNQSVQMSVSSLTNGTYIAKIYDGTQWYSNQFIVQH